MPKPRRNQLVSSRGPSSVRPSEGVLFALLAFGLVLAPHFRGLYFAGEQLLAFLYAALLFVARLLWNRRHGRPGVVRDWLDGAALAVVIAYLIATPTAAYLRDAIQTDFLYATNFVVYWLVRDLVSNLRSAASSSARIGVSEFLLPLAFGLSGLAVALAGFANAAGTVRWQGYWDGHRIYSAFQYPNTTAAYLAFAALWATGTVASWLAASDRANGSRRFLVAAGSVAGLAIIWLALVLTYSRGGWLVAAVGVVLLGVTRPVGQRTLAVAVLLGSWIGMAVGVPLVTVALRGLPGGTSPKVWLAVLAASVAGAVLGALLTLLDRVPGRTRQRAVLALAGLGVASAVLLLVYFGLPKGLLQRVEDINASTYSAWSRLQWTRDALRMVREHPLFGAGGGGWNALYHQYQSYDYFSTQVHNGFVQIWLEAGTVGLLAWLALWVVLGVSLVRLRRATGPWVGVASAGAVGALVLGLHSYLDFDLSLLAASAALWAAVGFVAAVGSPPAAAIKAGQRQTWAGLAVALAAVVVASALFVGFQTGEAAAKALNQGRFEQARLLFGRARLLDPWTATFWVDRGQAVFRLGQRTGNPAWLREGLDDMARGVRANSGNADLHRVYGNYLLEASHPRQAVDQFEAAVRAQPQSLAVYEALAQANVVAAEALIDAGRRAEAAPYLAAAVAVPARLAPIGKAQPPQVPGYLRTPAGSPYLALVVGKALALQGRYAEAKAHFLRARQDQAQRPAANLWLAAILQKQGDAAAAQAYLKQAGGGSLVQVLKWLP